MLLLPLIEAFSFVFNDEEGKLISVIQQSLLRVYISKCTSLLHMEQLGIIIKEKREKVKERDKEKTGTSFNT